MTTENILALVGQTSAHLEQVKSQLFEVVKIPLTTGNDKFKSIETYGVYKSTGGNPLSLEKTRGKDFVPMQPIEFYDNILQTVHECGADLDLDTLTFKEFCGGSKIEFKIKMHPLSFKNDKGIEDITNIWLTFTTSYDGSKANVISLYTERLVCLNGMVRSKLEGALKGRNTINGKAKILSYCDEVAQIVNSASEFKNQLIELDKVKPTKQQIEKFKLDLLGYNSATLLASEKNDAQKHKILESLETSIALEFERTGETAFGLLQGVTYYTNHVANGGKKHTNEEYIRYMQGAKTNDKAQDLIFEMLN
jgi:hypothetical protein